MVLRSFRYSTLQITGLIILVFQLTSCGNYEIPENVQFVIDKAGDNGKELEKVLRKYSKKTGDSLKFKAACYLISNMPGHYGIYHHNTNTSEAVFENLQKTLLEGFDSLQYNRNRENRSLNSEKNKYRAYDTDIITSEFLIQNIENSFHTWRTYPWCQKLDYADFEKYILPYRSGTEPLMNLRSHFQKRFSLVLDSMKGSASGKEVYALLHNKFYHLSSVEESWEYGRVHNIYDIIRIHGGLCYHETLIKSHLFRALGLPCAFDEIPQWANRSSSHSWNAYLSEEYLPLIIDGTENPEYREHIHSSVFEILPPGDSLISVNTTVHTKKKVAKVYRKRFRLNPKSIFYNNKLNEEIPPEINNIFLNDVTSDYLPCFNIKIPSNAEPDNTLAYLCLFNRGYIVPIDWGLITNNIAKFKNVAGEILYLVVIYQNNKFYPVSTPFILGANGQINYIEYKPAQKKSVILYRKYPLFGNILNYANQMYRGKFQGANLRDFSDAVDLLLIDHTPLKPEEYTITRHDKFRYLRYLPEENSTGDVGDITFYCDSGNIATPVHGKTIFKHQGALANPAVNAFDNNAETFYSYRDKNTWIGLDLGKGNEKNIVKIKFNPRTDTNYIIPGNIYELFYWRNGWQSLGKKTAKDYYLNYDNVPENALLWLYCHSGGREERPFTYDNGKQIWW